MVELVRTIRFCLNDDPPAPALRRDARVASLETERHNTYAAWPAMRGLGRYYELRVACHGQANPVTGYFINISEIDAAVRRRLLPFMQQTLADAECSATIAMGALMGELISRLQPDLNHTVANVRLVLTPTLSITIERTAMDRVTLRQSYEFSAAHRLHVEGLSDEENREIFGKCNNPAGHGHNYRIEVAVSAPILSSGHALAPEDLDRVVDEALILQWDHKNLDVDLQTFEQINSSVENISRTAWEKLSGPVAALGEGVELKTVSVWETGKTVCTYPA